MSPRFTRDCIKSGNVLGKVRIKRRNRSVCGVTIRMDFKKWLENACEVQSARLTNTAQDLDFAYLKSKYQAGTKKDTRKLNPEKTFGKATK